MNIRPIRTAEDHEQALKELETLWSAEPGSPEEAKLEVLGALVDDYERRSFPMGDISKEDKLWRVVACYERVNLMQMQLLRHALDNKLTAPDGRTFNEALTDLWAARRALQ